MKLSSQKLKSTQITRIVPILTIKFLFVLIILLSFSPLARSFDIEDLKEIGEIKELDDVDKELLSDLTEEEQKVQSEIFNLSREVESLEEEQESIEEEIDNTKEDLEEARSKKEKLEEEIQELEAELKEVFRSFQRTGPLSYFEMVLDAEDLRDFLRRLNVIKDVFSNVNNLFAGYIEERDTLAALEDEVTKELSRQYELEEELEDNIARVMAKKEEQEEILESVQAELQDFEEQMNRLETIWIERTRPFLTELAGVLESFIEDERLDEDKIDIGGTFLNPVAELSEENFNSFFEEEEELPDLFFEFKEDEVFLELPGGNLTFKGEIVSVGDTGLSFEIMEARFFDIFLGEQVIEELTRDINLGFDFAAEMGSYRITEVTMKEGKLVLDIEATFFR